jgi:flagellar hook-associated protein 1
MPISSFYGLQTSLRGLVAQQRSIDVTGHNIANVNTEGYSRQTAALAASQAMEVPAGAIATGAGAQLGSGVDVQSYSRMRDAFLDVQFRTQSMSLGEHETRAAALDNAELSLAEPSDNGLNAQLGKFWNAWSDVANNPESPAARQALVSRGAALADAFNTIDAQLATVGAQTDQQYAALTAPGGEVDTAARDIAELNNAISQYVSAGESPNDLLDRRDKVLDHLASLGQVSVKPGTVAGTVDVAFGDAADPLVQGTTVTWPQALSSPGGKLGALKSIGGPSGEIAGYRATLDGVAAALASQVNALQATGSGGTGAPFFATGPGGAAGTLRVTATAAQVQTSTGTTPGANDLAQRLAGLRGAPAVDGTYQAFVAKMGTDVSQSKRQESNAAALVRSVDDRRSSVSGVALDEEMTNLVRFQRAYQASARAMSTMDEMLDVLINRTGKVGL